MKSVVSTAIAFSLLSGFIAAGPQSYAELTPRSFPTAATTQRTNNAGSSLNVTGLVDPRKVSTPDGRTQFMVIGADGLKVITPIAEHLVLWKQQLAAATQAGIALTLDTPSPQGCTCGQNVPPIQPCECSVADIQSEMKEVNDALAKVCQALKAKFPYLGWGWCGNVTHLGPKCTEVSEEFWDLWHLYEPKNLKCIKIETLFDSGCLPFDILAHIFMGVKVKQCDGSWRLVYYLDPWRYGNCFLYPMSQCPNSPDPVR